MTRGMQTFPLPPSMRNSRSGASEDSSSNAVISTNNASFSTTPAAAAPIPPEDADPTLSSLFRSGTSQLFGYDTTATTTATYYDEESTPSCDNAVGVTSSLSTMSAMPREVPTSITSKNRKKVRNAAFAAAGAAGGASTVGNDDLNTSLSYSDNESGSSAAEDRFSNIDGGYHYHGKSTTKTLAAAAKAPTHSSQTNSSPVREAMRIRKFVSSMKEIKQQHSMSSSSFPTAKSSAAAPSSLSKLELKTIASGLSANSSTYSPSKALTPPSRNRSNISTRSFGTMGSRSQKSGTTASSHSSSRDVSNSTTAKTAIHSPKLAGRQQSDHGGYFGGHSDSHVPSFTAASNRMLHTSMSYYTSLPPRPYKGFSTPFCGMFRTSGGIYTGDDSREKELQSLQEQMRVLKQQPPSSSPSSSPNGRKHRFGLPQSRSSPKSNTNQRRINKLQTRIHALQAELAHNQLELSQANLRTDLCSVHCLGVLQSDYTRYLYTSTPPPTFLKRSCCHILTPVIIFLVAGWCSGHIRSEYMNSLVCTSLVWFIVVWIVVGCVRGRKKRVAVREEMLWRLYRRELKWAERMEERKKKRGMKGLLLSGMTANRHDVDDLDADDDDDDTYEYYSEDEEEYDPTSAELYGQTRFEMNCAHRMFGCYPSDVDAFGHGPNGPSGEKNDGTGEESGYILQSSGNDDSKNQHPDLCTNLWNLFTYPLLPCFNWSCCGSHNSYGCHLQFCGLCGLAQEAREANISIPRHYRMMDYITMEPFLKYYPKIVQLRLLGRNGSFLDHCRALSHLSTILLQAWLLIIVILLSLSLWSAVRFWKLADFAVLTATFLQSFIVMYMVHWGWHRYDLSIDAVIKYFACGFVLCTGMAFTIEASQYLSMKLVLVLVVKFLGVSEVKDNGFGGMTIKLDNWSDVHARLLQFVGNDEGSYDSGRHLSGERDILQGFFDRNPWAVLVYSFLTSYIMAGLVEEVCKYFGFVMVDHPDFCSEREMAKAKEIMPALLFGHETHVGGDDVELTASRSTVESKETRLTVTESPFATFDPTNQRRSLSSIRAGVTVAMVAVALGFTCCENIVYILVYNRSSLTAELATLVMKSMFPIHAVCAAIQSIHVCRRDLEKDMSFGLGRIVLPSVIIHGTYDFLLLTISKSWQRSHKENYFYQGDDGSWTVTVMSFFASVAVLTMATLYYIIRSRAQYVRLQARVIGMQQDDFSLLA